MPSEASGRRLVGTFSDRTSYKSCLDASSEDPKDLYLMFGDQLSESNQDSNLHGHLSMILHGVSKKASVPAYPETLQRTGKGRHF